MLILIKFIHRHPKLYTQSLADNVFLLMDSENEHLRIFSRYFFQQVIFHKIATNTTRIQNKLETSLKHKSKLEVTNGILNLATIAEAKHLLPLNQTSLNIVFSLVVSEEQTTVTCCILLMYHLCEQQLLTKKKIPEHVVNTIKSLAKQPAHEAFHNANIFLERVYGKTRVI